MKKGYTNFTSLNKTGQRAEKQFTQFLISKGYTDIENIEDIMIKEPQKWRRSSFDIRCKNDLGVEITFEVKAAYDCNEWGWITIEQVQNGKLGGIPVSEADYVVYVNDELGFAIEEHDKFMKIHWEITKQCTMIDYKRKKHMTLKDGTEVKLWKTDFTNWAAGWRMKNEDVTWYK